MYVLILMLGGNKMKSVLFHAAILSVLFLPVEILAQCETSRVSVGPGGVESNGFSRASSISLNGRYVAFHSEADNLVAGDTNGAEDIFVHDRQTGTTARVSVSSLGVEGNDDSLCPFITPDGQFVVFYSYADNLVTGDNNGYADVFVHDRLLGTTTRASVNAYGQESTNGGARPSISADGRYVAFETSAGNLVSGDTNGCSDIFVHDRQTGGIVRVSVDSLGGESNDASYWSSISPNGRYVAFESYADNLVPNDTNWEQDIFVHDVVTGETFRASVSSTGEEAKLYSQRPSMASDGSVAFYSQADNLVSGDTKGWRDVFVHNVISKETVRVSVDSAGAQGNKDSTVAALSSDGSRVVFLSSASNLVSGETNKADDIFLHDMDTGMTVRMSLDSSGVQADYASKAGASISPDGQYVAFSSWATNLVDGDTNMKEDVFVRCGRSLSADTHLLHETGGTVNFTIDAGASNGNRNYLIMGSVTPSGLGIWLSSYTIALPLEWDIFTDFVLTFLNTPAFSSFLGKLDAAGEGTAQINSPALPAGVVGVRMYFAYCLNGPFNYVSNPVLVEIVP